MKTRKAKGFTLIELMIVIAIIGILAAILVPNFMRARSQSQVTACKSNLKNIGTACEMYATDNSGFFPGSFGALTSGGNYMRSVPVCPSGSTAYSYSSSMAPNKYTINCQGANYHTNVGSPTGFPQYTSAGGLQER